MATYVRSVLSKSSVLLCVFLWAKYLNAKDIHKEMFPVYGGMCLSCKAVHKWVEKFSQKRSEVADDARPSAEVAETTDFYAAGFDALGINVGGGHAEK
jgi:hypothetical protein